MYEHFTSKNFLLPNTIQITMLFPMMAVKSIVPNKKVHNAFCSTEISYGRTGGGDFRHSPIKSLWQILIEIHWKKKNEKVQSERDKENEEKEQKRKE